MERSIFANDGQAFFMVNHLKNSEVDRGKWDRCIESASFETIYPYSWYLDLVAPGWEALVMGDYESVMPLTLTRKMGMKLLLQPILAQQLGIFSPENPAAGIISEFLDAVKRNFRYADICLNRMNLPLPVAISHELKVNHVLELAGEPEYHTNTRRNLAKGKQTGLVFRKIDLKQYLDLKFRTEKIVPVSRAYMGKLFSGLQERGSSDAYGVFLDDRIHAGAILAYSSSRAIYLNGCSNEEGKDSRAMFVLMDQLIGTCRNRFPVFDFEGSSLEGVGRFFEGYGAVKTMYPRLRIRKFPFTLR